MLTPLGEDIWITDGGAIRFYGMPFPTRMTVIRLRDGAAMLHSPIALTPELVEAVTALGELRHLIAPNWIHYAFVGDWAARFPEARVWAAPGVSERARAQGAPLRVDQELTNTAPPEWAAEVGQLLVAGHPKHREVVFFHKASRSLILTDLIENMPAAILPRWLRPLARLGGIVAPNGRMPLDMWLSFRKAPLRAAVRQMLEWAPERVVLAHGEILERDIDARLRAGFRGII